MPSQRWERIDSDYWFGSRYDVIRTKTGWRVADPMSGPCGLWPVEYVGEPFLTAEEAMRWADTLDQSLPPWLSSDAPQDQQ